MMQEIGLDELQGYVEIAFSGDIDLPTYHISNEANYAQHTYEQIVKTAEILPLRYYKVGEFGFTVLTDGLLYSFGINHAHRDKKTLELWFAEIKNILGRFDCVLHSKNSRAINHLVKQGMKITDYSTVLSI